MAAVRQIMWQGIDTAEKPSLEHLQLGSNWASGSVIGRSNDTPFTLRYRFETDSGGFVVACVLRVSGQSTLTLNRSTSGRWQGGGGEELRDLSGCTDLDLSVSPVTNSLTLRRLQLRPGASSEVLTAWIEIPTLQRRVLRQRYTRLGPHTYRYENLTGGFTTELSVDDDLFVRQYPGQFRRIGD